MAKKDIMSFGGVAPRVNPALLPDHMAQTADNCTFWKQDLRSLKQPSAVVTPTALGSAIKSIYRIGQTLPENQYWMAWTGDVNVVRGLIAGDTSERTYYTGDGVPKVTDLTLATQGGTAYPVNAWTLGIPKPALAPTLAASSNASPVETRVYVYTYVSAWGEEGKPSNPTKVVVSETGSVTLSNMSGAPAGNYNIASRRIYRSQQEGNGAADYLFVAEISISATNYVDSVAATDLGEVLSTADYDMPPATMAGIAAMPNGVLVGFDGYDLLFCEPFVPYAWPVKYRLTADYPIVGLGVFGSSVVVCTTGKPYIVTGTHPENMSMERLDIAQACVSKRSIVSTDDGVIYASPDGLVFVGAGGAKTLTEERYTRADWQALNPSTITGFWTEGRYIGIFSAGCGFILDAPEGGNITFFDDVATAGYVDLVTDALYLCIGGVIKKFNDGANKTFTWRSKKFQHLFRNPPGFAMVDADAYPVTFKVYWDGVLMQTETVGDSNPFSLTGDDRPREIEIEVSGTNPVRYVGFADTYEEFNIG